MNVLPGLPYFLESFAKLLYVNVSCKLSWKKRHFFPDLFSHILQAVLATPTWYFEDVESLNTVQ